MFFIGHTGCPPLGKQRKLPQCSGQPFIFKIAPNLIRMMTLSEAGKLGATKSKVTFARLLAERIAAYNVNPAKCGNCQKPLDYNHRHNKYCGHSCSATKGNIGKNRHINKKPRPAQPAKPPKLKIIRPPKPKKFCKNCGKVVTRQYCNLSCLQELKWKKHNYTNTRQRNVSQCKSREKISTAVQRSPRLFQMPQHNVVGSTNFTLARPYRWQRNKPRCYKLPISLFEL
jgi:hypothetical protein